MARRDTLEAFRSHELVMDKSLGTASFDGNWISEAWITLRASCVTSLRRDVRHSATRCSEKLLPWFIHALNLVLDFQACVRASHVVPEYTVRPTPVGGFRIVRCAVVFWADVKPRGPRLGTAAL